jgi:hypothetical protein
LTYAEHPGSLILQLRGFLASSKDPSQRQAWGVCRSEVKEEAEGPGDMSGGGYPKPAPGSAINAALIPGQSYGRKLGFVLSSNLADFIKLGNLCLPKF